MRSRQNWLIDNMFFKFLFVFALVAAAHAATTMVSVFRDSEEGGTTIRNPPSFVIPEFEREEVSGKVSQGNLVLPEFEDGDSAQIPSESGNSAGGNGTIISFPTIVETTGSNGEQQTTKEIIAENTEDLSGQAITSSGSVTQAPTRRPGLQGLFEIFGNAAQEVVKENADRLNNGINSILGAGQSILHASNNIRDAKLTAAASIPRGWHKVFEALDKQE